MLISVAEFRLRTYDALDESILKNDTTEGNAEAELVIGAASRRIENFLHRQFRATVHQKAFHPYGGKFHQWYRIFRTIADEWPIREIVSVKEIESDGTTTDSDTEVTIYSRKPGRVESERHFAVKDTATNKPLEVRYAAGYRLSDETDAEVNTRIGTDAATTWPIMPLDLSQEVTNLVLYISEKVGSGAVGRDQAARVLQNDEVSVTFQSESNYERKMRERLAPYRKIARIV